MARKARPAVRRTVEVISPHPLVLRELEQALSSDRFHLRRRRIHASPAILSAEPSRALLYVVDAEVPRPTTATVVSTIQDRYPKARILVVAERFTEADAFALLRLGVKGLVRYEELRERLPVALDAVADGGFWAPRALVGRFMDELAARGRRARALPGSASLSAREREVLGLVLKSLSNKEIASRLHISERTVKFHVSNLLTKFHSKSRSELLLQCLSADRPVPAPGASNS
jgi:DNA-binding NarL/FixJ family response regulator